MKVDKSKWKRLPLKSLLKECSVKNKSLELSNVYSVTNSKGFVPASDYFDNTVQSSNLSTYKIVDRGMFAYNPSRINVGSIALLSAEDRVIVSPLYVIFSIVGNLNPAYLLRFLKSEVGLSLIRSKTSGSVRASLRFKDLASIELPVPSMSEQESIASELDALQEVIAGYREQIADLDALAQSIFLDTFGDPVTNPKGWELKRLDEVCDPQLGKMINQQTQTGELKPFLCAVNVLDNDFYVDEIKKFRIKNDEEEKYRVLPGDLMICEGGDAGRCAIWNKDFEIYYQKSVHRVRSSQLSMQYLMFVLRMYKQQGVLAEKSKGATIQHLTKKSLNQLLIMCPPITLQNSFSEKFAVIEDKKEMLRQQLADAEMLMAERMQYYFS